MMNQLKKILLIAILLILMLAGGSFGLANIYFKQAEVRVKSWQLMGQIASDEDYRQAMAYANDALIFHPGHNQYLEIKAQILEWGADEGFESSRTTALQQAKELYLQSTASRPTWPNTWAALAMLKWRMQEFDDEMLMYLHNAFNTGKNAKEVKLAYQSLGEVLRQFYPDLYQEIEANIDYYQTDF